MDDPVLMPAKTADALCNARTSTGYCDAVAGAGTRSPGAGRCSKHKGVRTRRPLRWDDVEDLGVRQALDKFAADEDALDSSDDIILLRALILKQVNEQARLSEAILAWAEQGEEKERPRDPPSFANIVTAIDKLSGMVEKEVKRRAQGGMTVQRIAQLLTIVGRIVMSHVRDEETLRKIREEFLRINLHDLSQKR